VNFCFSCVMDQLIDVGLGIHLEECRPLFGQLSVR
jgi:hypothetical protein